MKNIYETSWGYDMTINDYIKVLEMGSKTAKVVMIGSKIVDDNGMGSGKSYPAPEIVKSEPFRLRVKAGYDNKLCLRGSYPYVDGSTSKRMGTFYQSDGNGSYYNTWD